MAAGARLDLVLNGTPAATEQDWPGGDGTFFAESSNWGGGTVDLQVQNPRGTWLPVASLNQNGTAAFSLPPGKVQAVVTTAANVYAYAIR